MISENLRYTKDHEWVKLEGDVATIGISDHAQAALGDITFVEPADVGNELEAGDEACAIESCKAAATIYAPVAGTITEFNEALDDNPELLNQSPYENGWIFKLKVSDPSKVEALMDAKAYEAFLAEEA